MCKRADNAFLAPLVLDPKFAKCSLPHLRWVMRPIAPGGIRETTRRSEVQRDLVQAGVFDTSEVVKTIPLDFLIFFLLPRRQKESQEGGLGLAGACSTRTARALINMFSSPPSPGSRRRRGLSACTRTPTFGSERPHAPGQQCEQRNPFRVHEHKKKCGF